MPVAEKPCTDLGGIGLEGGYFRFGDLVFRPATGKNARLGVRKRGHQGQPADFMEQPG